MSNEAEGRFPWRGTRPYNSLSAQIVREFGGRVQKVSIDAGFTCPNRDGTTGRGGCTYCNNDAFNPLYCTPEKSITEQILQGISFHRRRYRRSVGYLAYFQAYTNSYESVDKLEILYNEALAVEGVKGLVIGTRPDCVNDDILELFASISEKSWLLVEYGIESCYNKTLRRVNRGHSFEESESAVRATSSRGIRTGAHLIFGLPGESREEMLAQASILSDLPLDTIKFHQLQIVRGTRMEKEYNDEPGQFDLFNWDEYRDFVISFAELLNPAIAIDRFTGEAPPAMIIAPRWNMKRTDSLIVEIEKRMEERETWQGRLCGK
ncbi:MAG: TIGR01212 family radical SAM protein [Bacteroidales bacterium]|nr:TIGR01212 family radical SAM protein [Bacteroidales bacterium]